MIDFKFLGKTFKEIWNDLKPREKRYLHFGFAIILIIGFIAVIILPFLYTLPALFPSFDYSKTGAIGETINGISSPFIALLAIIVTFLAFYIQYKANVLQKEQFTKSLREQEKDRKEQEKIWRIERLENKFYELLRIHKSNTDEITLPRNISGSRSFRYLYYELKTSYLLIENFVNNSKEPSITIFKESKWMMSFAYKIFFFGCESEGARNIGSVELNLYNGLSRNFNSIMDGWKHHINATGGRFKESSSYSASMQRQFPYLYSSLVEIPYTPFEGHSDDLGKYYRNLYQSVQYIVKQQNNFLTFDEKYGYIKTLRAQLSSYEQLLLYYNALAWFIDEWREIFTTYRFIKNIPIELADFCIKPVELFKTEIKEWEAKNIALFEHQEYTNPERKWE